MSHATRNFDDHVRIAVNELRRATSEEDRARAVRAAMEWAAGMPPLQRSASFSDRIVDAIDRLIEARLDERLFSEYSRTARVPEAQGTAGRVSDARDRLTGLCDQLRRVL